MGTFFFRVLQAEAIPLILGGGDVLMAAETGSGRRSWIPIVPSQKIWRDKKLCIFFSLQKLKPKVSRNLLDFL